MNNINRGRPKREGGRAYFGAGISVENMKYLDEYAEKTHRTRGDTIDYLISRWRKAQELADLRVLDDTYKDPEEAVTA